MSDHHTLRLSGDCGLRRIRTLLDEMAAALATANSLEIDCASAERIDLSFVQLVTSAERTARSQAKPFRVVNLSDAARTAFARAGLPVIDRDQSQPNI